MRSEKSHENYLRRKLAKHGYRLIKTPSRSWLRSYYPVGYMILDGNTVVSGCSEREYVDTLLDVHKFLEGTMKRENKNPAFHRFKNELPKSGLYPERDVDIFWNVNDDLKIIDVEVAYIPRRLLADPSDEFWNQWAMFDDQWISNMGNSLADWLGKEGDNPATIFGYMSYSGFDSKDVLEKTLEEFAHIEECQWARDMLRGFRDE